MLAKVRRSSYARLMRTVDELAWVRQLAAPGAARNIREAAGLSGPGVARELGVPPSALSRWERGVRRPRPDAAKR